MSLLEASAGGIVLPEQIGPLIIQPLRQRSTALQVCTEVQTLSPKFRLPVVDLDAASTWLAEGADITTTDPTIGEEVVSAMKLGALTRVSNELANDSSPAATSVVGDGLTRSIARQLDVAFFGTGGGLAPPGLLSLSGIATVTAPGSAWTNFDWALEAQSALERVGSTVTAFCASFETVRQLSEVKSFTGTITSNQPLLNAGDGDVTTTQPRNIFGVPLFSLPEGTIADGIVWALDRDKTYAVIRQDIGLMVDPSFYFGSDSLAVRVIMRIGFGYPHHAAVCKISLAGGS
jgi:HK97 family phage major capsid protein